MKNTLFGALSLAVTLLFAPAISASARAADADPAAAQIQTFCDALIDTMKHGKELGVQGRYNKLKPTIEQVFDLPLMTSLVVGSSWASLM